MAAIGCPACAKTIDASATTCPYCGAAIVRTQRPAVVAAGPSIACEKCKTGKMWETTIPRFSPVLRIIGFTLAIPSVLLLAGATVFMCGVLGTGTKAAADSIARARTEGAQRLATVPGLPPAVVEEFRKDGSVAKTALATLSIDQRQAVEREVTMYNMTIGGSAIGGTAAAGIGGCGLIGLYFFLVPTMIVGFVLTLTKKVWRCGTCSYVYDRA